MEQTAINWLFEKLWETPIDKLSWYAILEEAKEMQKDQIAEAYELGWINGDLKKAPSNGENYYEDKYSHPDPSDDEIYNNFNHEGGIKF
jgi:hypothetical protein